MNIFSTRGRYGLRLMLALARSYGDGPIALAAIAERTQLSEHYLEQLVAPLRKCGLVISQRGALGGYRLARAPCTIHMDEVMRILEGPLAPAHCVDDTKDGCENSSQCAMWGLWMRIRDSLEGVLKDTTLKDLVADELRLGDGENTFCCEVRK